MEGEYVHGDAVSARGWVEETVRVLDDGADLELDDERGVLGKAVFVVRVVFGTLGGHFVASGGAAIGGIRGHAGGFARQGDGSTHRRACL